MKRAGWRYWPIVEPVSVVGKMSMGNFKTFYADKGIKLHIVRSVAEGLEWVKSQHSVRSSR